MPPTPRRVSSAAIGAATSIDTPMPSIRAHARTATVQTRELVDHHRDQHGYADEPEEIAHCRGVGAVVVRGNARDHPGAAYCEEVKDPEAE